MITFVVTLCLVGAPETCERRSLPFDGPLTACVVSGQALAADYLRARPRWRVQKWRCELTTGRAT